MHSPEVKGGLQTAQPTPKKEKERATLRRQREHWPECHRRHHPSMRTHPLPPQNLYVWAISNSSWPLQGAQ